MNEENRVFLALKAEKVVNVYWQQLYYNNEIYVIIKTKDEQISFNLDEAFDLCNTLKRVLLECVEQQTTKKFE